MSEFLQVLRPSPHMLKQARRALVDARIPGAPFADERHRLHVEISAARIIDAHTARMLVDATDVEAVEDFLDPDRRR